MNVKIKVFIYLLWTSKEFDWEKLKRLHGRHIIRQPILSFKLENIKL
jgi:hypothetical protein